VRRDRKQAALVRRLWQALVAALTLGRAGRSRRREHERGHGGEASHDLVEPGPRNPGAELAVAVLFLLAALSAVLFIVVYSLPRFNAQHELFGLTLAGAFGFLGAALVVLARRVLPSEELEEDYPDSEHPEEGIETAKLIEESGRSVTRKRLLTAAGGTAGGAIGLAALTPALSLGPWFHTKPLLHTPWRAGRRLVDRDGKPYRADEIEPETFYTAFAEGASQRSLGAMLVVVRLNPERIKLPRGRRNWAPEGILAFSKVCTHAGCAIGLYRKPTYPPTQPPPGLVCPCHYSTFDPGQGGKVVFGPAGRPLPQLPLLIDREGELRARGNFSNAVGPGWWGVNLEKPS
jgi:ubiquinol-cytochrome c reductase iron-sulfur subunit